MPKFLPFPGSKRSHALHDSSSEQLSSVWSRPPHLAQHFSVPKAGLWLRLRASSVFATSCILVDPLLKVLLKLM